ncbi:unnamed protein product [Phytophthora fragariaefolia]|uniref:Unnamed protein product n=1 Tax=Phytophthora fragariaefolia TaxID=1490495 RepID=A0A9W6XM31_9STRA|nr:unnamed protein product [Phytophthora fragariaefolia]
MVRYGLIECSHVIQLMFTVNIEVALYRGEVSKFGCPSGSPFKILGKMEAPHLDDPSWSPLPPKPAQAKLAALPTHGGPPPRNLHSCRCRQAPRRERQYPAAPLNDYKLLREVTVAGVQGGCGLLCALTT